MRCGETLKSDTKKPPCNNTWWQEVKGTAQSPPLCFRREPPLHDSPTVVAGSSMDCRCTGTMRQQLIHGVQQAAVCGTDMVRLSVLGVICLFSECVMSHRWSQVDVQLVNTACTGQGAKCTHKLKDGEWSGDDYSLSSLTPLLGLIISPGDERPPSRTIQKWCTLTRRLCLRHVSEFRAPIWPATYRLGGHRVEKGAAPSGAPYCTGAL